MPEGRAGVVSWSGCPRSVNCPGRQPRGALSLSSVSPLWVGCCSRRVPCRHCCDESPSRGPLAESTPGPEQAGARPKWPSTAGPVPPRPFPLLSFLLLPRVHYSGPSEGRIKCWRLQAPTPPNQAVIFLSPSAEGAVTQEPLGGTAGPRPGQEGEGQENSLRRHSEASSFLGQSPPGMERLVGSRQGWGAPQLFLPASQEQEGHWPKEVHS